MSAKKRKREGIFDLFNFNLEDSLVRRELAEEGSGYSISMTYDGTGKPVVQVETHGDIDREKLRREIEAQYPGAKIEGLEKRPLIRVISEEETKEKGKPKQAKKREKQPLIRLVG